MNLYEWFHMKHLEWEVIRIVWTLKDYFIIYSMGTYLQTPLHA
jgi:hypothetical protein